MVNYKAVVEYDGTEYCGFQIQPDSKATIQGCLQEALGQVAGYKVSINYAGRTDAGPQREDCRAHRRRGYDWRFRI